MTSSGCFWIASEIGQKMMPRSSSCFWYVVATETLSNTASTATPVSAFCSASGMPSLLNAATSSGSTSSRLSGPFSFFFGAE